MTDDEGRWRCSVNGASCHRPTSMKPMKSIGYCCCLRISRPNWVKRPQSIKLRKPKIKHLFLCTYLCTNKRSCYKITTQQWTETNHCAHPDHKIPKIFFFKCQNIPQNWFFRISSLLVPLCCGIGHRRHWLMNVHILASNLISVNWSLMMN